MKTHRSAWRFGIHSIRVGGVEERHNTSQDFFHDWNGNLSDLSASTRFQIQHPRLVTPNDAGDRFSSAHILRRKRYSKAQVLREGASASPLSDGHYNSNVSGVIEDGRRNDQNRPCRSLLFMPRDGIQAHPIDIAAFQTNSAPSASLSSQAASRSLKSVIETSCWSEYSVRIFLSFCSNIE